LVYIQYKKINLANDLPPSELGNESSIFYYTTQ